MSAATMLNPAQGLPHRKPVPARTSYQDLQQPQPQPQQMAAQYAPDPQRSYPPRTMTNSASPPQGQPMYSAPPNYPSQYPRDRRTLSTSTTSTNPGLQRTGTTSSQNPPRRSTSSRSAASASPTSYVALMRKQKATVWCDRAQVEDAAILAKRRAIKHQAAMDVAGGAHRYSSSGNSATQNAGIRSKIRHHGLPKANAYTGQGNLAGAGVPLRLSAQELDEGSSDEELGDSKYIKYHSRTGSRGSSMGSGQHVNANYLSATRASGGAVYTNNSTPRSDHSPIDTNAADLASEATPVPNNYGQESSSYFEGAGVRRSGTIDPNIEAERIFGGVGGLPQKTQAQIDHEAKVSDDLRRRGSVDDRTMTMGGGRLFVANPDLSD